ncbi:MAG: hypothetical protein ACI9VN_000670 [Patescibacteria group bacterium]|jgi:hypothetical protein
MACPLKRSQIEWRYIISEEERLAMRLVRSVRLLNFELPNTTLSSRASMASRGKNTESIK